MTRAACEKSVKLGTGEDRIKEAELKNVVPVWRKRNVIGRLMQEMFWIFEIIKS
jgi:hypothetical protein